MKYIVVLGDGMADLPIEELNGKNRNAALTFLRKNEKYCVQLAANLRKNIAQCFVVYAGNACGKNIYGIVSIKKTVLHCLPFANENEQTALQEDFIQSFADLFAQEKFENPVCIKKNAICGNAVFTGKTHKLEIIKHCDNTSGNV